MNAWESFKGLFGPGTTRVSYLPIAAAHVDPPPQDEALVPEASYFQIWLDEVALAKQSSWGRDAFPAVQSEVRLQFAGQERALPTLARPPEEQLVAGARLNWPLTPLLPFNGGQVEVQATLVAIRGLDHLAPAVDALTKLGGLIGPPVGQTIALADALASGIRGLFEGGDAKLGLHQTFVAGEQAGTSSLRPSSIAVVAGDLSPEELRVRDHQLHVVEARDRTPKPVEGTDYMLLRIEGRSERPDWRFPEIHQPLTRAQIALEDGNETSARGYRAVALAAAYESPDIAERDRRRIINLIKLIYEEAKQLPYGVTGGEWADLDSSRGLAISREQAIAEGAVDESQLFA